tara:strand:- start:170 stop:1240 length:1071 start_codon:yes stop_codon:yes gene_type:complete
MHVKTIGAFALPLLLLLLPAGRGCAEDWENPSERYSDAYLEYVDAICPIPADGIHHYVFFARDRDAMRGHPFLSNGRFEGAQIMYSWRQLEPARDEYDFSVIVDDARYLAAHGKRLFVQLQDATFFDRYNAVPDYLLSPEFDGGAIQQRTDDGRTEGWVAKRWNPAVRERFARLLVAMGDELDGVIAGVNLQETAIGVTREYDPTFSPERYVEGLQANMRALGGAFSRSVTMQYANFVPGEWLPWEDNGYLRSIYSYGEEIGVGLGAPDLLVRRKGQLNHALAMMHEGAFTVPIGIAVQDGNYIGETGTNEIRTERHSIVPMLHAFAHHFLGVSYMFWSYQEPYFSEDVIPCFSGG